MADLVVIHRVPLDGFLSRELNRLRSNGAIIAADADDLVFDVKESRRFSRGVGDGWGRRLLFLRDVRSFRETIRFSDFALVSTEYLATRVRALGTEAWVHRNAFSAEMLERSRVATVSRRNGQGRVILGFASGTPTHRRDLDLIRPALIDLLRAFGEVEILLIGHIDSGVGWAGLADRVQRVPFRPWQELPSLLADVDVCLAPLERRPFCEAKSEVKFIEAGLVGVPTVATANGAFRTAITHGKDGLLCESGDDWSANLKKIVGDAVLRQKLGEGAHRTVMARYAPEVQATELGALLKMIESKQPRSRAERSRMGREARLSADQDRCGGAALDGDGLSATQKLAYALRHESLRSVAVRLVASVALRTGERTESNDR